MIEILIVGTNKPITDTIARLIDKDGVWLATASYAIEQALALCSTKNFRLILIGAGIENTDELKLKKHLAQLKLSIPVVKHYGGGSGLLFAEIYQALAPSST